MLEPFLFGVRHGDDLIRGSFYILDNVLEYKKPRKYRMYGIEPLIPPQWRRHIVPFNQRGNHESRIDSLRKVKSCRMSFFLRNKISAPIEIYVDNIGCSVTNLSLVDLWKEGGEAEPI